MYPRSCCTLGVRPYTLFVSAPLYRKLASRTISPHRIFQLPSSCISSGTTSALDYSVRGFEPYKRAFWFHPLPPSFFANYLFPPTLPAISANLTGKRALVTGANQGLGYDSSRVLLQKGVSELIMAVRNPRKGEEAKASLLTEPSIQALPLQPKIEIIPLDLGSFQSARTFSDTLNARYDYLDIVLLNAGAGFVDFRETTDGYEELLQVNYLSNSLLAVLVYPLLQAGWNNSPSAPTRLTIVGSSAQFGASFSDKPPPPNGSLIEYINTSETWNKFKRYSDTKVLISMFVRSFTQYLTEKNIYGKVIVNLTCPGMLANSSMTDELPFGIRQLAGAVKKFRGRSPEQAGVSTVYAIAEAGEESQGKLIFHNQIQPTTPFALTDVGRDMEKRLWTETVEFLDNQVPGCFERFY